MGQIYPASEDVFGEDIRRWVMERAGEPLKAADAAHPDLGPNEVLVEVDACSLWRRNVERFAFGATRGGDNSPEMLRRINGHVVETREDALYLADRPVVMSRRRSLRAA